MGKGLHRWLKMGITTILGVLDLSRGNRGAISAGS